MLAAGDRSPMKPAKFDSITACGTVCLLVLAILPTASAIPLEYTVSSLTLPASGSDTVIVNPGATAPLTFKLNDGLSNDFVFFTLSPNPFPISGNSFWTFSSSIDFSNPAIPALAFNGSFDEGSFDPPLSFDQSLQSINLPGDRSFTVELLTAGNQQNFDVITVTARVTQTRSTAPPSVPDTGSTAVLLGVGFLALAFAARTKVAFS
jgi:VPDSG-CTERM motif